MAATRDPTRRRKIRALEAKRDTLIDRKRIADVELKKVRAELKAHKGRKS